MLYAVFTSRSTQNILICDGAKINKIYVIRIKVKFDE